jgi:hypothetical protein
LFQPKKWHNAQSETKKMVNHVVLLNPMNSNIANRKKETVQATIDRGNGDPVLLRKMAL